MNLTSKIRTKIGQHMEHNMKKLPSSKSHFPLLHLQMKDAGSRIPALSLTYNADKLDFSTFGQSNLSK